MAASSAALESCEQGGSSAPDSAGAETPLGQGPVAGVSLPADSQDLVTPPASPEGRVVSSFEQQLEGLLLEAPLPRTHGTAMCAGIQMRAVCLHCQSGLLLRLEMQSRPF